MKYFLKLLEDPDRLKLLTIRVLDVKVRHDSYARYLELEDSN